MQVGLQRKNNFFSSFLAFLVFSPLFCAVELSAKRAFAIDSRWRRRGEAGSAADKNVKSDVPGWTFGLESGGRRSQRVSSNRSITRTMFHWRVERTLETVRPAAAAAFAFPASFFPKLNYSPTCRLWKRHRVSRHPPFGVASKVPISKKNKKMRKSICIFPEVQYINDIPGDNAWYNAPA